MRKPFTVTQALRSVSAALFLGAMAMAPVHAEDWPTKPIRLVVPAPPGGITDGVARLIAHQLQTNLGQAVIVDNKPGAGGSMGMDQLARSPADGYTLAFSGISTLSLLPHVMKVAYDPIKQFRPVASTMYAPVYLLATKAFAGDTVADVLAAAKKGPKGVTMASSGYGTLGHIMIEQFTRQTGANLVHVPYKGGPEAITAVLRGETCCIMNQVQTVLPHAKSGKVRLLGVTTAARVAAVQDVPPIGSSGLPGTQGFDSSIWFGLSAPRGTDPRVVALLEDEITKQTNLSTGTRSRALLRVKLQAQENGWPLPSDATLYRVLSR